MEQKDNSINQSPPDLSILKEQKEMLKESAKNLNKYSDIKNEEKQKLLKINKLAELRCKIFPFGSLSSLKYVVVCSYYNGKILLSRRKDRTTWETQGGHIETGESAEDAARRELYEESGVSDAKIYPVCDYLGYNSTDWANGSIFYADVVSIGKMPEFEMAEIQLFDDLPKNLTYPNATPEFFKTTKKLISEMADKESSSTKKQEAA